MKRFIKNLIGSTVGLILVGCVSLASDPDYASHEAHVLTSPQPDAIVGMWYHRGPMGAGSLVGTTLFSSNGTGLTRANGSSANLKWRYDGTGWWTATASSPGYPDTVTRYRTDGTVLLYVDSAGVGPVHQIWVRGDDDSAIAARQGVR